MKQDTLIWSRCKMTADWLALSESSCATVTSQLLLRCKSKQFIVNTLIALYRCDEAREIMVVLAIQASSELSIHFTQCH
jgi:hypothetical protein